MTNEDLKRFYKDNPNINEPNDFVRFNEQGKIPTADYEASVLYKHHFNVVLTTAQTSLPEDVTIHFNYISSTSTAYKKLADAQNDGFIASAFGSYDINEQPAVVLDVRLVNEGIIFGYATTLADGSSIAFAIPNMGNTQVFDSVTKI